MGLAVEVGMLADLLQNDPEGAEWFEENLAEVNKALLAAGHSSHSEPRSLPELQRRCPVKGYPYSYLHYLRRVAAKRLEDPTYVATPLPAGEEPDDPAIDREMNFMRSHLICHSDNEGFYVPIPFLEIVFSDNPEAPGGGIIGSSDALFRELVSIAPALGIALVGHKLADHEAEKLTFEIENEDLLWIEKTVWFDLFEAARLSLEHDTAIVFS